MARVVTTRHVAEMVALAEEGLGRADIVAATGWSYKTAGRYVGDRVPPRVPRRPDLDRLRRMIAANAAAEHGTRDDIAHRFGLKNRFVLKAYVVAAREMLRRFDGESAA